QPTTTGTRNQQPRGRATDRPAAGVDAEMALGSEPTPPTPAEAPDPSHADQALAHCRRVLHQNWRTGEHAGHRFAYTSPSPHRYPWQWYWDSCLTAVAWRHFDPSRSRAELGSLLDAATPEGFIG